MPLPARAISLLLRAPIFGIAIGAALIEIGLKPFIKLWSLQCTLGIGRPAFATRAATTIATPLRKLIVLLLVLQTGATRQRDTRLNPDT